MARAGHVLCQLVGDVAGVEVGEDENVGPAGDGALAAHFLRRDARDERAVGLELAVDGEAGRPCFHDRQRLAHLVGEHAAPVRARICEGAAWLGLAFDADANAGGGPRISTLGSAVGACVVPTDEELMIARHTRALVA